MEVQAFTLKSDPSGVLRTLKTSCGVSLPHILINGTNQQPVSTFTALWDTGATGSVISKSVVSSLNLIPTGKQRVFHADGECVVNTYLVNLYLPNSVAFPCIAVTEGKLTGIDILIGMDVITQGDFSITNHNGNTFFSFRIPSIKDVDFVEEINHTPAIKQNKIGRNSPCHCGSGKKYKNCCGR